MQRVATAQREQALKDFNVPGAAPPTSALQQALTAWRSLYDAADEGAPQGIKTNKIDWDKFEALQKDLFAQLTPEQIDFIQQRSKYQATPEAQWWFNNRDYVNSTAYYDIPDTEFQKRAQQIAAINPSVTSYGRLVSAVDYYKLADPNMFNRLNNVLSTIKSSVSDKRLTLRQRDPKLDAALYTLGRANNLKTVAAKNLLGGGQAWVDANTGTSD